MIIVFKTMFSLNASICYISKSTAMILLVMVLIYPTVYKHSFLCHVDVIVSGRTCVSGVL